MQASSHKAKTKQADAAKKSPPLHRERSGQGADVQLQRAIGNQAVQSLAQSGEQEPVRSAKASARSRELAISQPGDNYEREADQVAERVMQTGGEQRSGGQCAPDGLSQTITPLIQSKGAGGGGVAPKSVSDKLAATQGRGGNLDNETQSFMQERFGVDFSGVGVHTDAQAAQMNRELNARAFTVGNDIYFGEGQYRPHSEPGRRLLAHELTHTLQQTGSTSLQPMMIQCDFAVEPTAPEAVGRELTEAEMRSALRWNQAAFSDADEIALLRDVLGISAEPAVIDEAFIRALVQYQANYGLTQDGLLGAGTARRLADELRAEGDYLGAEADVGTATEMAINPAERRMRLRSRVVGRLGRMLHQGFIGPRESPTGVVTVRSGFSHATTGAAANLIGINYTGANVANARWLQFVFRQMSAIDPATGDRVYRTGPLATTSGPMAYSDGTTFRWVVDTVPATGNMYYEAGGTNERVGAHTEIFDQPGSGNALADAFAGTFGTRPNRVRMIAGFDTYLVVNNNSVVYHVRWNVYYNLNTSVTPTADVAGTYEVLSSGAVSRLPGALKTVLDAQFPTNTVP